MKIAPEKKKNQLSQFLTTILHYLQKKQTYIFYETQKSIHQKDLKSTLKAKFESFCSQKATKSTFKRLFEKKKKN